MKHSAPHTNAPSLKSGASPITFCAAGIAVLGAAEAAVVVDVNTNLNAATSPVPNSTSAILPLPGGLSVRIMHQGIMTLQGNNALGAAFGSLSMGSLGGFLAGANSYGANLPFGAAVSAAGFVPSPSATLAFTQGLANEEFGDAGIGYLGFRFDTGGGDQYGWVELDMSGGNLNAVNVIRYAYGDPGEAVFAGLIPEPSSLALLALGAGGLMAQRRRREG